MTDIGELFDRNPLGLTDPDVDAIVARMRQGQTQFELGVKTPVAAAKPKKSTKAQDLLKDLGL